MHRAYGDRSGSARDRFWSFALVTLEEESARRLADVLIEKVSHHGVAKVEWKLITGNQEGEAYMHAAIALIDYLLSDDNEVPMRIDVISWDRHDSRHAFRGRDDNANTGYMVYKLFMHVGKQWRHWAWDMILDRGEVFDRNRLVEVINNTYAEKRDRTQRVLLPTAEQQYLINHHEEKDCDAEPLLWIADLFAGMYRWNRARPHIAMHLSELIHNQLNVFEDDRVDLSRSDEQRTKVLDCLLSCCKKRAISIDCTKKNCLWTKNNSHRINFWPYEPQGDYDRAPEKSRESRSAH
ncbi:MAG: hypothetical protein B1H03_06335 [Planctomycetales bacterium 4484_113]|nr:MAG: hypothetical protein B1H03_06335 [Planctomycetales bacterium 4484_113]